MMENSVMIQNAHSNRWLRAMVTFAPLLIALAASACTAVSPTEAQSQLGGEVPPGFMQVLQAEAPADQRKFLELPKEKRDEIIQEWKERADQMKTFSPAERVVISSLSQDDSDKFFEMANRDEQQKYLADKVKSDIEDWIACRTETHRTTD